MLGRFTHPLSQAACQNIRRQKIPKWEAGRHYPRDQSGQGAGNDGPNLILRISQETVDATDGITDSGG